MKILVLLVSVCLALIALCVGIAGAIIMGITDENKCGDGCRADLCNTNPCTCGTTCMDYAVKSDNHGNKTYFLGATLTGAGFGSFVLIIILTIIFKFCSICSKKNNANDIGNPVRNPEEIHIMIMSPSSQNSQNQNTNNFQTV